MIKKIEKEQEEKMCPSPEHNPPSHLYLEPGKYEHTCPACGKTITFTVFGAVR